MPPPVLVVSVVPACVVEEPEDREEYTDTWVAVGVFHVEPQPFQLRDYRTGRRVGVLSNSVRGLQYLAMQHLVIRDPVLALNNTTQISTDGYLMSLHRNEVVVAVPRDQWDRMY